MTAPPPAGALKSDGRRLVRDDGMSEDESPLPPPVKSRRRAAMLGGFVGLLAVLAVIGASRAMGGSRKPTAATEASAAAVASAAAPPASARGAAAPTSSGVVTATVPLFGVTPLSTTESVPAPPASASGSAGAAPGAPPPVAANDKAHDPSEDDDPSDPSDAKDDGPPKKEWGTGGVSHPVVLKIKMDGAIERIHGASGAMGFTLSIPGRRSLSNSSELTRKDKRLASVSVLNNASGAEVTVQFKDGVPPYLAKANGDRLEIALGTEKKIASKGKKHGDEKAKKKKGGKKKK
jgi:hypothetical protein